MIIIIFLSQGESQTRAKFSKDKSQVEVLGSTALKGHYMSILPTMIRSFGLQFLFGSFLKFCHDILQFVSPMLIKYKTPFKLAYFKFSFFCSVLIDFTESEEPAWHGYLYAVALLVVTQLQSFFLGQYFLRMYLVGLKIRTAMISAVYRKVRKNK